MMSANNEAFEKALDLLIDEAVNVVNNKENETEAKITEVEFSARHEKKMKHLFKEIKRERMKHNFLIYGKRAACICLVALILTGASIFSVDAWRVKVLNFFFDEDAPNSKYNFNDLGGTHYIDENISLSYVPWGFKVEKSTVTSRGVMVSLKNENLSVIISVTSLDVEGSADTEDAVVSGVEINGYPGVLIEKENDCQVLWNSDEYSFCVLGNLPKEEIIKIAENMEKI